MSSISELVDLYYQARELRLEADRRAAALDKIEKEHKARLLDTILGESLTAAGGKLAVVKLQKKEKPNATDWLKVFAHIRANDEFDLLHKRLTESACQARWDEGIIIPGVEKYIVYDLTVGKPNV